MSQHDYNIANQAGIEFRADLNEVLQAIVTQNSGATEPAITFAGMEWLDESTSPPTKRRRNQTNDGWITILSSAGQALSGAADVAAQLAALGLAAAAKTNVAQNYTAPQRAALTTDNDLSFDLAAKQAFKATTSGAATLTFTKIPNGLPVSILLINAANHAIAAHANTKISTAALSRISATGTYLLSGLTDGTYVWLVASEKLA